MPNPLPYFPFYPNDWDSNTAVRSMSFAERGLYISLLNLQWRDGVVPDDAVFVARVLGANSEEVAALWPTVRLRFDETSAGLRNHRLESERARAIAKSERASKSARSRYVHDSAYANAERTQSERTARASVSESVSESPPKTRARDPLTPPPGFEVWWSRYKCLRDAGRRRPCIAVWLECGCERQTDAVLRCFASYERSRDRNNGAVQNGDTWLRAVFDSGFTATWPAAEATNSRGDLPEWKPNYEKH